MDHAKKIEAAGLELANAVTHEMELENNRHTVKLAAIERIMKAGDNTLTGKPHSFSSAEAAVSTDEGYMNYLGQITQAVRARIIARSQYDAAIAAARIASESVA